MNCHTLRNLVLKSKLADKDVVFPDFDAHCVHCPDCRRWHDEQLRFDALITTWNEEIPSVDLSDSIVEAHLRTIAPPLPSTVSVKSHRDRFTRGRLAAFLTALTASLVFLLPRMENLPSIGVVSSPADAPESVDATPVESIVSSLRNVVVNTPLSSDSPLTLISSSSVLPDWRVGSIELAAAADATLPASDWTDVGRELEPLGTEVKQALGFIWHALPQEEI